MEQTIDELSALPDTALIAAYAEARRKFVARKFERDTQRARLEWMRARMFLQTNGGVTERRMAVDTSEELARKGQEVREMTRELDQLKVDVDTIDLLLRLRSPHRASALPCPDDGHGEFGGLQEDAE